jgi:glutathione S-transferase
MLTLYYCPGACSMASHITIEETGAAYTPQPVQLVKGEHQTPEYLRDVNARGKVPALKTDDGVITENVAILTYLARSFPDAQLQPSDPRAMPVAHGLFVKCSAPGFYADRSHRAFYQGPSRPGVGQGERP